MKVAREVGRYYDKIVELLHVRDPQPIENCLNLEQSTIIIVFDKSLPFSAMWGDLIRDLVDAQPLSISLYGCGAELAFDVLIRDLSDGAIRKHTMTKLIDEGDIHGAIEDFFWATWPSDSRFNEWERYLIIFVAAIPDTAIVSAVREFLEGGKS